MTMRKKKIVMARLVRLKDMDRSFDREFWKKIGPQGRFSAAWEMVKEYLLIRGKNGRQQRLQRSIQNIKGI